MPIGNGETTALVFPITEATTPSPPLDCKLGPLLAAKYCALGQYIGCHDTSCQIKTGNHTNQLILHLSLRTTPSLWIFEQSGVHMAHPQLRLHTDQETVPTRPTWAALRKLQHCVWRQRVALYLA